MVVEAFMDYKVIFRSGLLLSLAACAATEPVDSPATGDENTARECVNVRTIRSFDGLTDQHVYVDARSSGLFLFTMRNRCNGLRNAFGITIKNVTSQICPDGFAEIVYEDLGRRLQTCRIDKILRVESKDDARAIVEQLQKDK